MFTFAEPNQNRKIMTKMINRIAAIAVIAMLAVSITSCDKDLANITIPYSPEEIRMKLDSVDVVYGQGEQLFYTYNLNVNIDSIIKAKNAGSFKEAKMVEASVKTDDPNSLNFDWLKSLRLAMAADGVPEATICEISEFDGNLDNLNLQVKKDDITAFIKAKNVVIKFYGDLLSEIPYDQIEMACNMKFELVLNPLE